MMCYKDRTYCSNPDCDNSCGRKFTDQDRINAIKWWGSDDFPLCVSDFHIDKPIKKEGVTM